MRHGFSMDAMVNALMCVTVRWDVCGSIFESLLDYGSSMIVVIVKRLGCVDGFGNRRGSVLDGFVNGRSIDSRWFVVHILVVDETSVGSDSQNAEQYDELNTMKEEELDWK